MEILNRQIYKLFSNRWQICSNLPDQKVYIGFYDTGNQYIQQLKCPSGEFSNWKLGMAPLGTLPCEKMKYSNCSFKDPPPDRNMRSLSISTTWNRGVTSHYGLNYQQQLILSIKEPDAVKSWRSLLAASQYQEIYQVNDKIANIINFQFCTTLLATGGFSDKNAVEINGNI